MAPEVALGEPHSYPSDVYGWAHTMHYMLRMNWATPTALRSTDLLREFT